MWNCLVNFSTWAEGNSGQIQILIAGGAIYLAWLGYKKVLEQIEISHKQMHLSIKQNGIQAKLNTLNVINENIKNNIEILKSIPPLVMELEEIQQRLQTKNEYDKVVIIQDTVQKLKTQGEVAKGDRGELDSIANKIAQTSYSNEDDLNHHLGVLYETLIRSTGILGDYQLLVYDIEKIKIEEKLK